MIALFIHIFIISSILIGLLRKLSKTDDRIIFCTFTLLKITCGLLIGLLYWSYYGETGDTIYFFEQAQALFHYFQDNRISFSEWIGFAPLSLSAAEFSAQTEPRTFFFVRLMSLLYALTQGNYFTMSIYLSLFSALTTWAFAYELGKTSKCNKYVFYVALLFIPSVIFWSSGLLKESIMTFSMYALGFLILKWMRNPQKWLYAIPVFLSIYLLWKVKYYVPITLLPLLILTLIFNRPTFLNRLKLSSKLLLFGSFVILGGLSAAFLHPVFSSGRFFELLRISHDVIAHHSEEAIICFQNSDSDLFFFTRNLPLSWFTGFFRPFIWESFSILSFFWAIEKTVFTLLTIAALAVLFKVKLSQPEKWWSIAILIYSSVLASVITLASPNFGTLIRYEVAYMPFLWLVVLMVLNKYKQSLK